MLKTLIAVGLVGFGALASGCSVETGEAVDEEFGSSSAQLAACLDAQGAKATQAALAVAMGDELGRWDPLNDLQTVKEGYFFFTRLKPGAVCVKNNCALTKAILGQQNFTVDQNNFNADNFRSTLEQGFGREKNLLTNLSKNSPSKLPPAHKLTKVGGPTAGTCGGRYLFQVDHTNGTPLTAAEASNMQNTLCYFGQDTATMGCGGNKYVGFTVAQTGCPAGRVCVAIDSDSNDTGTASTTPSSKGPIYPMNRIYNPSNALLNTACTTTNGRVAKLQSKCSAQPNTCGFLYCSP